MTWLIIGSAAARHWFPDWRQPRDIDILTPAKVVSSDIRELVVDTQWHDVASHIIELSSDKVFADPEILLTLKVSHSYWNIHFDKTLFDIHEFQKRGVQLNQDLHDRLIPVWTRVHGEKKVSMNKTVEEFFDDVVPRKYPHELLHEIVAFGDRPMHTAIRRDLTKVLVDRQMFFDLPFELQCRCALEEILVTAIERGNLNLRSTKIDRMKAVKHAHAKLCTSMTKGWFAQFLVFNHYELLYNQKELWQTQLQKSLSILENT